MALGSVFGGYEKDTAKTLGETKLESAGSVRTTSEFKGTDTFELTSPDIL